MASGKPGAVHHAGLCRANATECDRRAKATRDRGVKVAYEKAAANWREIYAPVSGEVVDVNAALKVDVNAALKDAPEKINSDPHGQGWLVKVRLRRRAEIDALMDATTYEAYVTSI